MTEGEKLPTTFQIICRAIHARLRAPDISDESGAALVEFTVVAPLFFLLMFGVIQFGSLFYTQNNMLNAAREAVRSVAVQNVSASQAQTVAQNYLKNLGYNASKFTIPTPTGDTGCIGAPITMIITTSKVSAALINYLNILTGNLSVTVVMPRETQLSSASCTP